MPPRLPDSRENSAVVRVLQDTEILRIQATQRTTKQFTGPTGLRIIASIGSRDLLGEVVARTEATSPVMSYKMKVATAMLQPIGEPAIELNPRASHEPMMAKSGYFTFLAHHNTNVKKGAKRIKSFLMTAGGKFLTGLQVAGKFYAHSEQKWESEYHPFEHLTSNTTALQAIDADNDVSHLEKATKHSQKSWHKRLQNYWKPELASEPRTVTFLAHRDDGIPNIPPISDHLQRQNNHRPSRIQCSQQPIRSLGRGGKPQSSERIQLTLQPSFSPPEGGLYTLEYQLRSTYRSYQLRRTQQAERMDEEGLDWENDEEDLGTPWSGLETVTEEGFFPAERTWADNERRESEEGIGEEILGDNGDGMDCDGLEAGGELCLRHETCLREAMALGGM